MVLHGRDAELALLEGAIAGVGERGCALLVRGEPGVGKSALVAEAARGARAARMLVLQTAGVQSEAHLGFAGLHQLLQPLLAGLAELPAPHRDALGAAFGMTDRAAPEPFLLGLATLELIADAAARAPVLVVVEDAQWLDRASADVIAFVARRVGHEPIVMLVALRDGWPSVFESAAVDALFVGPLDAVAAVNLLEERAAGLAPELRHRILHEAAGNPLALVELPKAWEMGRGDPLGASAESLPLTAKLERAFAARAVELPRATRTALLLAAANDGTDLDIVLRATGTLLGSRAGAEAIGPAIADGLIRLEDGRLTFRHPLMRSAIYGAAGLAERQEAHAALAEALADDPDRSLWHRAAACGSPHAEVAAELEGVADRARRRGASAVALAALERAARLTADPALRGGRLLKAGEIAFELGGPDLGVRFLRDAEPLALSPIERARHALLRELFEDEGLWAGPGRGVASFVEIADRVRTEGDPELALNLLLAVAQRCWWAKLEQGTRDLVVEAAGRLPVAADHPARIAIVAFADPLGRGREVVAAISRLEVDGSLDSGAVRLVGAAATAVGAFDRSPGLLAASVDGLRAQGRVGLLSQALVSQAWAALLLGNWRLAIPAAEEAARLAEETGQPRWGAAARVAEATLAALRGDPERADSLCDEAERLLLPLVAHPTLALVQLARGTAALARGLYPKAFEHLRRTFDPSDLAYHPVVRTWAAGDLAEAAAHGGHTEVALELLGGLEALAERSGSALLGVGLAYARALLAEEDAAEEPFRVALTSDLDAWPFQRARLQLAYGSWLRRRRRVAESRAPLRAARELFDALGAIPWGERARRELRASGETTRRRATEPWDRLSPQELQIAHMAATGMTNRQIGQKLYLSHRTVGSHLYRIFPKLGITSRAQLGTTLVEVAGDAAPPPS